MVDASPIRLRIHFDIHAKFSTSSSGSGAYIWQSANERGAHIIEDESVPRIAFWRMDVLVSSRPFLLHYDFGIQNAKEA